MILKNQVEWALHCMVLMARLPKGTRLATKELAHFHGIPKEYLLKALQALSREGLVDSQLGVNGGYRLAKPPEDISFLDIIESIEGKRKTFNCTEIRQNAPLDINQSAFSKPCFIAKAMWQADEAWRERLRQTTIQDMLDEFSSAVPTKVANEQIRWLGDNSKKETLK